MNTYQVSVEKTLYCTGTVEVKAKDPDQALAKIQSLIDSGKLQTTQVEWGDPEYEDGSFKPTGDIE